MHAPPSRLVPVESRTLAQPGIAYAFFTRQGGVSSGLYASLNTGIGSKDDRTAVTENRARAARHLGAEAANLATPYQVHGTETAVVREVWGPGLGPKADAVATNIPGIAVGVGTADCGPVLFADAEARVVAAAHAGWKGALAGILESAVEAMEGLGAKRARIVAVLGPTISQDAYEVGPEFVARFAAADPENARYFRPAAREGHAQFDLPAYIVARLARAGISDARHVGRCTYGEEESFFSFRRATHRGDADYGRNLSAIMLA
jgi:YfiH family protein